jgi:hypothetical protein
MHYYHETLNFQFKIIVKGGMIELLKKLIQKSYLLHK